MARAARAMNEIAPAAAAAGPAGAGEIGRLLDQAYAEAREAEQTALRRVGENLAEQADAAMPPAPEDALPPAIAEIRTRAVQGQAEAQHDLAAIYTAGHGGVRPDFGRAVAWFRKAASQGVANASYNLGVLYHQGLGVQSDTARAIMHYRAAAHRGHPEARYNLGIAHIEGIGVAYNPWRAAAYFEKAAAGGVMEAAYNLGLVYDNGLLERNYPERAMFWYDYAAQMGSEEAASALDQLMKNNNLDKAALSDIRERVRTAYPDLPDPASAGADTPDLTGGQDNAGRKAGWKEGRNRAAPSGEMQAGVTPAAGMDFPPGEDPVLISRIQRELVARGLYPGPANGVMGPMTADALRSYQRDHGLAADGRISAEVLAHMVRGGGKQGQ